MRGRALVMQVIDRVFSLSAVRKNILRVREMRVGEFRESSSLIYLEVIKGQDRRFDTEKRRKLKVYVIVGWMNYARISMLCYVEDRKGWASPPSPTNVLTNKYREPLKPTSNLNPSPKRLKVQGQIGPYLALGCLGAWVT